MNKRVNKLFNPFRAWGSWVGVILFLIIGLVVMPELRHVNNKCSFYSFAEEIQDNLDSGYEVGCECIGNLCGGPIVLNQGCVGAGQMDLYEKYKIRGISKFNCKSSILFYNSFDTITYTFGFEEIDMIGGFYKLLSTIVVGFLFGGGIHFLIRRTRN